MSEDGTLLEDIGMNLETERATPTAERTHKVSFANDVQVRYFDEEEGQGHQEQGVRRRGGNDATPSNLHRPIYTVQVADLVSVGIASAVALNLSRVPALDRFPESMGFALKVAFITVIVRLLIYLVEHLGEMVSTMGGSQGKRRRRK